MKDYSSAIVRQSHQATHPACRRVMAADVVLERGAECLNVRHHAVLLCTFRPDA